MNLGDVITVDGESYRVEATEWTADEQGQRMSVTLVRYTGVNQLAPELNPPPRAGERVPVENVLGDALEAALTPEQADLLRAMREAQQGETPPAPQRKRGRRLEL
jgi:hypothetical protein